MTSVNLIFFNFEQKEGSLISELIRYYNQKKEFDVKALSRSAEVNQYLLTSPNGIFFFQIEFI